MTLAAVRSLGVASRGRRRGWQFLVALAGLLFASPSAVAQRPTLADGLKAAVLRADEARVYAMLAADVGALDDMLTPDCLYVHSNGATQTKAELLAALKGGAMKYTSIRYAAPPRVRLYGPENAVLTGMTLLEVALPDGRTAKPTVLITAVYVVQNDRWQLASYQSTPAPAK
jgi:ketosteroid isomerase-like protein